MEPNTDSETSDTNSIFVQLIALGDFIASIFLNTTITIKHANDTLCRDAWWTGTQLTGRSCRENSETEIDMSRTLWMTFRKYATAEKRAAMIDLTVSSGSQKYGIPFL
jgi:hypothetical protein